MKKIIALWALLPLAIFLLTGCEKPATYQVTEGSTHTYYRIKYLYKESLDEEINAMIKAYHHAINPFDSTSIISAVNNNTNMQVDTLFTRAFNSCTKISEATDGMFDVTCAPLINLWGFGFKNMGAVTQTEIDSLKKFVGYDKVKIQGKQVVKEDPRILLNFSAIGDGYLCDLIAELLERHGIKDYLVDIGGEVMANGKNPKGNPWTIGINKPVDDTLGVNQEIQQIIQLPQKTGVATSGNYRNFYIKDGKKYAHTINPKTGYPADGDILSATVIAPNGTYADGFATAFMAMGREKAKKFITSHPELEYYFIYADDQGNFISEYSEGMKKYFKD